MAAIENMTFFDESLAVEITFCLKLTHLLANTWTKKHTFYHGL